MCCTCRAKLLEGEVEMAVNYSLEAWELAAGYVLTCQSRPKTAKVVLDYDQV
jgi:ring-1,2-phenylacetyl-CoA epoxidase subunit PaaE